MKSLLLILDKQNLFVVSHQLGLNGAPEDWAGARTMQDCLTFLECRVEHKDRADAFLFLPLLQSKPLHPPQSLNSILNSKSNRQKRISCLPEQYMIDPSKIIIICKNLKEHFKTL